MEWKRESQATGLPVTAADYAAPGCRSIKLGIPRPSYLWIIYYMDRKMKRPADALNRLKNASSHFSIPLVLLTQAQQVLRVSRLLPVPFGALPKPVEKRISYDLSRNT